MFVELFVGTLTRYYSEQWQNARTRGGSPSPFSSPTQQNSVSDPVELQGIIGKWREESSEKLKEHISEPFTWAEGMIPPWKVDELGFEGYGGAVLLSAYSATGYLPRPTTFQKTWSADPAFEAVIKQAKNNVLWEIMNCGLWLPTSFQFGIGMKDPSGQPIRAGSIDLLWSALQQMNEANWNADPETISQWRKVGLDDSVTFDTQTRFGFSAFYDMCKLARETRLPLKLHY